jgi:hypothetical protein
LVILKSVPGPFAQITALSARYQHAALDTSTQRKQVIFPATITTGRNGAFPDHLLALRAGITRSPAPAVECNDQFAPLPARLAGSHV